MKFPREGKATFSGEFSFESIGIFVSKVHLFVGYNRHFVDYIL